MIVYDYNDPFATLWWMHGSVVPSILYLSGLCTLNGAISVYFKDSYNFFVDHTPHMYIGTTIGILLVLKAHLAYQQYAEGTLTLRRCQDSIRSIAVRVNAYGHASSESNARELVTGRIKIAKYLVVFWYSIVFHMRKQRSIPKNSNLILYLSHAEMLEFEAAGVRPLTCLRWLDRSVAHLRDKGCLSDSVACTVAAEVTKLMEAFGTMERIKTYQTVPFAYYQFCNWAVFLFCFTVPASIATHNTDYVASCLCSFLVCFVYFGINFIGNDLQAPFGNGPNDIPLERYGMVIENELYQSFHFFRFRYEHFALFQEGLVVYPPDDPRNMPSKALTIPKKRSPWTPARIKITAAVRLGIPRMRRLREAKMQREREVDDMVKNRLVENVDMAAVLKAVAEGGGGGGGRFGKGGGRGASNRGSLIGEGLESLRPGTAGSKLGAFSGDAGGADGNEEGGDTKPGGAAPAELLPESSIARQAAKLIKRQPDSEALQKLLTQITNARTPESDKQSLLALMHLEVEELDGMEEEDD